jgi:uncharacterized protein (TIGR03435 family)
MTEADDIELLRQYAGENSEAAFAALVGRHINLVYSVALRRTSNPHAAEEITQAVFIILARKAKSFSRKTILTGWLHQTTRLTAANYLRTEIRRQHREQEAYMQSALSESETWTQIAPLLDDAISKLGARDRDAILLRYFENKSAREMAAALRMDEPAAQKRVTRAVEKLRTFFAKRGVTLTAAAIAGAVSANSVQAAPVGLAATVTAAAAKGAAVSASTLTLIKGALKIMAWAKMKTTALIGTAIILAAGITAIAVDDSLWDFNSYNLDKAPPGVVIIRPTHFAGGGQGLVGSMLGKIGGRNTGFINVVCSAYNISGSRIIFDAPIPEGRFDYAVTTTNQPEEKLQAEIKKQFGLVAHREIRETEVLLLKTNFSNSSKMKLSVTVNGSMYFGTQFIFTNQSVSYLRDLLESLAFEKPVLDQTGLPGRYDFVVDWPKPQGHLGEKGQVILKENLINELGLELVPSREPIEMLVVEKVK